MIGPWHSAERLKSQQRRVIWLNLFAALQHPLMPADGVARGESLRSAPVQLLEPNYLTL